MSKPRIVELARHEYRRMDGASPREPVLAPGWYWGVLGLASVFSVKAAIYFTALALH